MKISKNAILAAISIGNYCLGRYDAGFTKNDAAWIEEAVQKAIDAPSQTSRSYPMKREAVHVAESPMPGDVIEINEGGGEDETCHLLRVLAVVEDCVGYKEYGRGRFWTTKKAWKARLENAAIRTLIRPGDYDMPF